PNGAMLHPLPNIESPARPVHRSSDHVEPAGFGPIPDMWPQRLQKFGSIDGRYMKERWPWYPHNFDWGFFNAAPDDQQIQGYLKGDEEFAAENLHPTIASFRGRLPGLRVRSFVNEQVRAKEQLREVPICLDTAWFDMDAERLVLVWRGHVPVRTEKMLEVIHLFVMTEAVSQTPWTAEEYRRLLLDALVRREADDEELEEEEEAEEEEEPEEEEDEPEEEELGEEGPKETAATETPPPPAAAANADAADKPKEKEAEEVDPEDVEEDESEEVEEEEEEVPD